MVLIEKLFFLAVRQLSKPIANRAKAVAAQSNVFKAVTVGVGRAMHRLQIQVLRLADGKDSLAHIAPLAEKSAVNRGAEFVSELVIYATAGVTIAYEVRKNDRDKRYKDAAAAAERDELRRVQLENEEKQLGELRELRQRMTILDERVRTQDEQIWHFTRSRDEDQQRAAAAADADASRGWGLFR